MHVWFGRFKVMHIIDFLRTCLTMFQLVSNLLILTLIGSSEALMGSCCLGGDFLRAPSVENLGGPGFCSTSPHSIKMAAKQITSLNPDFNPVVNCTRITFTRVLHLFGWLKQPILHRHCSILIPIFLANCSAQENVRHCSFRVQRWLSLDRSLW